MIALLVLKEKLKQFYSKYSIYVTLAVKFLIGCLTFALISGNIGFMAKLNSPVILMGLAVVCAFLPYGVIVCLAAAVVLAHLSSVSLELTLILAVCFLIIAILYYGFQPGDSCLLLLTPIFYHFKIPYAIPLLVGLSGKPVSAVPVGCGTFVYYTLLYVKQNAGILTNDASMDITQKYVQIMKSLIFNRLMLAMIAASLVSVIVVYLIRRLSVDYAWIIAIVAGAVAQLAVVFIGDFVFDVSVPILQLLIGTLVSMAIAGIYNFVIFSVDYTRTEYTQFEDDDYYYIDPMESDYTTGNTKLPIGTYLVQPDSQERVQVGNTGVLKGVYNINKGYTQFRQINILYQNEEYALVEQGTSYGLTVYDHIVLNGSAVDEDQIIY